MITKKESDFKSIYATYGIRRSFVPLFLFYDRQEPKGNKPLTPLTPLNNNGVRLAKLA
jgi:hypothetical protein